MAQVGTITVDLTSGTITPRITDDNGFSKAIELDIPAMRSIVEQIRELCISELAKQGLVVEIESRSERLALVEAEKLL